MKILLVDDHAMIRESIKLMLKPHKEFEVVAEASTGIEAIDYLWNNRDSIDIVLMDISMPDINGIKATRIITNAFNILKSLLLPCM